MYSRDRLRGCPLTKPIAHTVGIISSDSEGRLLEGEGEATIQWGGTYILSRGARSYSATFPTLKDLNLVSPNSLEPGGARTTPALFVERDLANVDQAPPDHVDRHRGGYVRSLAPR